VELEPLMGVLQLPARATVVEVESTESTEAQTPEGESEVDESKNEPEESPVAGESKNESPDENDDVQTPDVIVLPKLTMDELLRMSFLQVSLIVCKPPNALSRNVP
jgi:hypothetical protein